MSRGITGMMMPQPVTSISSVMKMKPRAGVRFIQQKGYSPKIGDLCRKKVFNAATVEGIQE
jgi:hypothetical protein